MFDMTKANVSSQKMLDIAKTILNDQDVKDGTKDLLWDFISVLSGDYKAIARIVITLGSSPYFVREKIFWHKLQCFYEGQDLSENERIKFCALLTENGSKPENQMRLIHAISQADTDRKIRFLVNASRSLLMGFIDLTRFFRICHTIENCIQEDLLFVVDHILETTEYKYSETIQGLLNVGLVYQSRIDTNEEADQRYKFTQFAQILDRYSLSYENVERYPNLKDLDKEPKPVLSQEVNIGWKQGM